MTFTQFEEPCDDPARDLLPGGRNVRAILTFEPDRGFVLSAQDGGQVYQITDKTGQPMEFRAIEIALARLRNVSGLSPDIGLLQSKDPHPRR